MQPVPVAALKHCTSLNEALSYTSRYKSCAMLCCLVFLAVYGWAFIGSRDREGNGVNGLLD